MTIQIVDLMEGARNYVKFGQVKKGDQVVIIADSSSDPMVIDALALAAEEAGAKDTVVVSSKGPTGLSVDNFHFFFLREWPSAVWEAAYQANVVFNLSLRATGRLGIHENFFKRKIYFVRVSTRTREYMASDWAKFPLELRNLIEKKANEQAEGKRLWHHTEAEGTDLSFEASPKFIGAKGREEYIKMPEIMIGIEPKEPKSCNGIIVSSATNFGPIPQIRITIKEGKVAQLEGGGLFGKRLLYLFEKFQEEKIGDFGKGVNWLDELMYGCHPKGQGSRMAGTIHHSIGGGPGSHGKVGRASGPPPAHYGFITFCPTLTADGEKIIDNGHMPILDDPEIRKVAAKYGDPEELLTRSYYAPVVHPVIEPISRRF